MHHYQGSTKSKKRDFFCFGCSSATSNIFYLLQIFCNTLFPVLALAARKDRDDQLLGLLWDRGLGHYLNSPIAKTYDSSYGFLSLICTGSQGSLTISSNRASSKSPPPDSTKASKFSILYLWGV